MASTGTQSWLFVDDDDGSVVRVPVTGAQVRIGRDRSNDIWLDHPGCATHALVLYRRDGVDNIKVYDGAKVFLNGVAVSSMHRLYGGDTIRVADRVFLYGRDDTPSEQCLGATRFEGEEARQGYVFHQTCVVVGRHSGDIVLSDPSVSDGHVTIESYGDESLFIVPAGPKGTVRLDDRIITGRRRIKDDALLQIGRVELRIGLVPADGFGLMKPLAKARVAAATAHQRMDAALHYGGAGTGTPQRAMDPAIPPKKQQASWSAPAVGEVAPTVIGTLATVQLDGEPPPVPAQPAARPAGKPRPRPTSRATAAPSHRNAPSGPSVKVAPGIPTSRPPSGATERQQAPRRAQPQAAARQRTEDVRDQGKVSGSWQAPPALGLHEQMTAVLQTGDVHQAVAAHYRSRGQEPPRTAQPPPQANRRQASQPIKQPARPAQQQQQQQRDEQRRPRRVLDRRADTLPPSPYGAAPQQGGIYRPSRHAASASQAAASQQPQLTGVMDIVADKASLNHQVHEPDPDAEQRRVANARARRRGGPVDDSPRRKRRQDVDNSPRYYDDEER
ncbi:MAG: FHA domain-containing protein [Myxococcales bacterium]|nr:FHA domain-containing protein [Myxococcales bacterium]